MEYTYQIVGDSYVLHRDGEQIGQKLDAVAMMVAVDAVDGLVTRFKHGELASVRRYAMEHVKKLLSSGGPVVPEFSFAGHPPAGGDDLSRQMAYEISVIHGRFPVNMLNDAIAGVGRAMTGLVEHAKLHGGIESPAEQIQGVQAVQSRRFAGPAALEVEDAVIIERGHSHAAPPAPGWQGECKQSVRTDSTEPADADVGADVGADGNPFIMAVRRMRGG